MPRVVIFQTVDGPCATWASAEDKETAGDGLLHGRDVGPDQVVRVVRRGGTATVCARGGDHRHPTGAWVAQQPRNLLMGLEEHGNVPVPDPGPGREVHRQPIR